jgi:hypothetical protein
MSTLNVSNITDGTDTVETGYVVNGSAKAWVNFNGQGTPAARDSFNLSSITDNGTGAYGLTFANAFSNGNFSGSFTTGYTASANGRIITYAAAFTTTAIPDVRTTLGTTPEDHTQITGSVHGDLA